MPSVLEKVRAAISPPKDIVSADNLDPIQRLAALEKRRREIEAQTNRLLEALKSVFEREREAYRAFNAACASDDMHAIESALADWLAVAPGCEHARREFNSTTALKTYGSTWTTFKAEFPTAKKVLLSACQFRLEEAKENARAVLEEATARLKHLNFSHDQIADDPIARRAAGRVRNLEGILARIQTEAVDVVWKSFARDLLA